MIEANCNLFAIVREPFSNHQLKAQLIKRRQNKAIMAAEKQKRLLRI